MTDNGGQRKTNHRRIETGDQREKWFVWDREYCRPL